jgi:hypothetical protein
VRSALAKNPAERPSASELLLTLVEQQAPDAGDHRRAVPAPPVRTPTPVPPRPSGREGRRDTATKAFTPPGVADTTTSRRTRLLAGAGAAAGTALIGAIIAGRTQGRNEPRR